MNKVIGMQEIRYLNLFEKMTHIRPVAFFNYNSNFVFVVPRAMVSKAVGEEGRNVKKVSEILGKRVKVVAKISGDNEISDFIADIIQPVGFNELQVQGDEVIISAGKQAKSALIGRDRRRLIELQKICKEYLGKDVRIV
jgi:NusA-like KH domain protein